MTNETFSEFALKLYRKIKEDDKTAIFISKTLSKLFAENIKIYGLAHNDHLYDLCVDLLCQDRDIKDRLNHILWFSEDEEEFTKELNLILNQ